jgi:Holliday junction resolvase
MGVNGKKKGNAFEREIANKFSEEFNDTFKRVPMSGGLVGGVNRKIVEQGLREDAVEILAGDVISPEGFPFSIECKSYKDFEFHQVLQGENKVLDEWIKQAEDDAKVSNKEMFLVMKFVRKGVYVCTHNLDTSCSDNKIEEQLDNVMWYKGEYIIYTLEDFLKHKLSIDILREWKSL